MSISAFMRHVFRAMISRGPSSSKMNSKFTNFIQFEVDDTTYKLVYRRYAGLFFTLCVEQGDNGLAYLETIHLFVEMLDLFFGNVCELDLVFNFHKAYVIVDEFFLAGEIQETSKKVMLSRLQFLEKCE